MPSFNHPSQVYTASYHRNGDMSISKAEAQADEQGNSAINVEQQALRTSYRHSLCVEILMNGYVESFMDLFNLSGDLDSNDITEEDKKHLYFLTEFLTLAESGHNEGDSEKVYDSLLQLAEHFETRGDYKKAVSFHERCLKAARATGNSKGEALACRKLGLSYETLHDVDTSLTWLEKFQKMAKLVRSTELETDAKVNLCRVYSLKAQGCVSQADFTTAINYYKKACDMAKGAADQNEEGQANYNLGRCYESMSDVERAISHYKDFRNLSKAVNNSKGVCLACSSLANIYQLQGDTETATTYLEEYLQLANSTGSRKDQVEASAELGGIYNRSGDYELAVKYFSEHYELCRELGDKSLMDHARVQLGIAKGNLQMKSFVRNVSTVSE